MPQMRNWTYNDTKKLQLTGRRNWLKQRDKHKHVFRLQRCARVCESCKYAINLPTFPLRGKNTLKFSFLISCFFFGFPNVTKHDLKRRVFFLLSGTRAPPRGRRAVSQQREQETEKMAELRKIFPESLPCRVNYTQKTSCQGKLFIFLCVLIVDSGGATTHWVVTEDGKIQQQVCQLAHWRANAMWLACNAICLELKSLVCCNVTVVFIWSQRYVSIPASYMFRGTTLR